MGLKSSLYKKQIVKKKMKFIVFYGIIFLISTMAYYFVNNSKAQNILKLETIIIDEEAEIEETRYELKATENDDTYTIMLPTIQNGFVVQEYTLITEEEYNNLTNKEEEKKIAEITTEEEITNEIKEDVVDEKGIDKEEQKQENIEENEKEKVKILPNKDCKLAKEEFENKIIYLLAKYESEEVEGKKLYNKVISTNTEKNTIIISGFMPKNAEVKATEVDTAEVENKIKTKTENEVKLKVAYDIKIIADEEEYEPNEFDKEVKVEITDIENENINIWHIKDDENIEKLKNKEIEIEEKQKVAKFNTNTFSVYGIEVIEEDKENSELLQANEVPNEVANEISNKAANEVVNEVTNNEEISQAEEKNKENIASTTVKKAPRRAAASNLPDSTLEIDDYNSDYYYYMGKNYTDDSSTTNNLVRVEINYYGFAQGETNPEKKGRISLEETEDIIKNIRCLPVVNGDVSIELMENPFMDKPTGYGFGGWTSTEHTISINENTKAQTLRVTTNSDVVVNVYANWQQANVVYVNGQTGSDNGLYTGLSEEEPFGSWGKAFEYLNENNTGNRETNIIVVTGDMDSSINYTRPVNKKITKPATVTYNASTSITSGETYILSTGTGSGSNAIAIDGNSITNITLKENEEPPEEAKWVITSNGSGYTIRNVGTGSYLAYNYGLTTSNSQFTWLYNNRRFYYESGTWWTTDYYIRYNNGWTTTTNGNNANQFYFVKYTAVLDENAEDIISYTRGNLQNNTYYYSNSYSVPVTVTSLYNHTDYRESATIDLTNNNYMDFTIYKDFQMDFVKINAEGYTSNNDGLSFSEPYPTLTGYANNVRLGRGIECANTNTDGSIFANIIGGATTSTTASDAYKLTVESGKYSSIQGFNPNGETNDYYGTVYLTLGNDIDRKKQINNNMSVYYRTTINSGGGVNGTATNEKAWQINVKSGKYGVDFFEANINSSNSELQEDCAYSGIYMGGYGTSSEDTTRDRSDRYMIVEGGLIANAIGGLKTTYKSNVKTRMYIKGGEIYNIVGGAGVSTTYEDRIIQVTGGTIRYSVNGGSNGVYATGAGQDGKIDNCNTLVYIGGNAKIGTNSTLSSSLYGVQAGCVLGAGNGNAQVQNSGQVDTTHIIINDNANILNSVYGGGNYGIVGASATSQVVKIDILGGTIGQNVYGGANQNNIYGSVSINMVAGNVKGAIYGGSNTSGTIALTSNINVTGGTLGTNGNTNPVLFGGGKGSSTTVIGGTNVNISDTNGNTMIYGNVYGGSAEGKIGGTIGVYTPASSITSGQQYIIANGTTSGAYAIVMPTSGTTVGRQQLNGEEPSNNMLWTVTGNNTHTIRSASRTNYYLRYNRGLTTGTSSTAWTYDSNRLSYNGYYIRDYNGTWTTTGYLTNATDLKFLQYSEISENGGTYVKIAHNTNSQNNINITGNVFAGGQGTNSNTAQIAGDSLIEVDGADLPNASIFGGNDINGTTNGNITVNIGENYTSKVLNVYGGGNKDNTGMEADSVKVYLLSHADVINAFNGGKSANLETTGTSDTTRAIYLRGGHADKIFGGSDTLGVVTASHVYIESGTVNSVFGGNNEGGQTEESFVYIQGGTATDVYGGGYLATTPTTNVSLTGGTITNGFGGGNSANVTISNITLNGTNAENIYGGSNQQGIVNNANVTITSGTVTNVYGGNNAGGNTVDTNVLVTSTVNNVYGGGNEAITSGNTYVNLNNATIIEKEITVDGEKEKIGGNVYGGGNGSAAIVNGNSTTVVQGTTRIQNDLFGSGNAAANGTQANQNSTVKLYITGGRIEGDVYGAANTSVVYGNTDVKIGKVAVNNNTLAQGNIFIGGTVFGGGKSNTAGSESYDFDFESVTRDANIDINAQDYDNGTTYTFDIKKSVFGSGNAAKISGNGYVNISNYGTNSNLKENISIQRATKVVLDNCKIYLSGTTDTTNEIATAVYTFNRIGDVVLKNNTTLYLESGVNIVSKLESVDSSNTKAQVTIGNNGVTNRNVDNRLFLLEGKNVILRTEDGNNGEVSGMTYVGIFKGIREKAKGIYDIDTYADGATIPEEVQELFERNSYVQGKHYASHNIEVDGFYTNYDEDGKINTAYIVPTPEDADYYQWIVGKVSTDIYYEDIELIATKYATTAAYVLQLDGLSFPNTTIKVSEFDVSDLSNSITLNNPNTIPNIAATAQEADSRFGLTMTAGNSGWQTKGTTNFLNNETVQKDFSGTVEYLSDNSNTTPTFSFYMDHSKNISSTEILGTVKIKLEANYVENEEMKRRNAYIIIKLTTNNTLKMDKDYYEGAITPGKQYSMFPTTATTITKKSSFSAYYSLYLNEYSKTKYYEGFTGMYYHVLLSSCVLPAKTKITLIDKSSANTKYYYYIVTREDETQGKKEYRFTDFKAMDSTQEPYSSDGIYYNSETDLLFEEFIVQVDLEDITLTSSLIGQNFLIQLRDAFDSTPTITVNTAQYPMIFSVYNNLEADSTLTLNTNKRVIHMGDVINMNIESSYVFKKNENNDTVYDTTNIDNQLGLRITVSSGSRVLTATQLEGIYIKYKNSNYYPRSDGSYRIKIADAVANVLAEMELHTEIGKLETGTYTIKVESFGSTDGTYFSTAIAEDSKDIQIVSSEYGFVVELDDNAVLIDKVTGKNKNDSNDLNFNIGYSGNFDEPKIVVSLYRRKYDQIYSYEYEQLDLSQYVTNNLVSTSKIGEYLVTERVQESQNYTLTMKNNLRTGTYKIVFSLYDGEVLIADMDKTVIIK